MLLKYMFILATTASLNSAEIDHGFRNDMDFIHTALELGLISDDIESCWRFSIRIEGQTYRSFNEIPQDIFTRHTRLEEYTIVYPSRDIELSSFILFRLFDKMRTNDEIIPVRNKEEILILMNDGQFMDLFRQFLRTQAYGISASGIENAILDASRAEPLPGDRFGTPMLNQDIRAQNNTLVKAITDGADGLYGGLSNRAKAVLGVR